jgi:osomolarity two-component system, response regulator SKN7
MLITSGMNDVLPKPFTKEGLLAMLQKHLGHLKVSKPIDPHNRGAVGTVMKEEQSPSRSPKSSWNSPGTVGNITGVSPSANSVPDDYLNPGHYGPISEQATFSSPQGQMARGHRRIASDMAGPDDMSQEGKRQRLYNMQQTHQPMSMPAHPMKPSGRP